MQHTPLYPQREGLREIQNVRVVKVAQRRVVAQGILGYLEKSGLRFSKKAREPSCASSHM